MSPLTSLQVPGQGTFALTVEEIILSDIVRNLPPVPKINEEATSGLRNYV